MINKIGEVNLKEIKRISPSQFYSMKNCAYKSLLAEAFDKNPLLPLSPEAYFGTVLHKIIELISKGVVRDEDNFNDEFDKQVKTLEDELKKKGFEFFVPLKLKLKNFGLKKIQLKKHLGSASEQPQISNNANFHSEKWYESKDKLIGGKPDLIIENGSRIEIIDFKTGAIKQDCLDDEGELFSDVKEEYKEQLKLYAYLYFESTNKFPTNLSLVNLAKQKFSIEFSEEECKSLFEEAKRLLNSTNNSINTKIFSANPKVENCKYCLYRPACSFFHKKFDSDYSLNDVVGQVRDLKKFQNGNVNLILENDSKLITIKNFNNDIFEKLNNYKNKLLRIYNLRNEEGEYVYSVTNITMIYEYE
jgi:CRISPR/Cas system-associated exonuclease Cas4 (RecB family)